MSVGIVLINGLKFPYFLVDYAVAWARKNELELVALFMRANDEEEIGYGFPSDFSKVSPSNKEELGIENDNIIKDQVCFFIDTASSKNVKCSARILINPSSTELLEKIGPAKILFTAPNYCNSDMLPVESVDFQQLLKQVKCKVEIVEEHRHS